MRNEVLCREARPPVVPRSWPRCTREPPPCAAHNKRVRVCHVPLPPLPSVQASTPGTPGVVADYEYDGNDGAGRVDNGVVHKSGPDYAGSTGGSAAKPECVLPPSSLCARTHVCAHVFLWIFFWLCHVIQLGYGYPLHHVWQPNT